MVLIYTWDNPISTAKHLGNFSVSYIPAVSRDFDASDIIDDSQLLTLSTFKLKYLLFHKHVYLSVMVIEGNNWE